MLKRIFLFKKYDYLRIALKYLKTIYENKDKKKKYSNDLILIKQTIQFFCKQKLILNKIINYDFSLFIYN